MDSKELRKINIELPESDYKFLDDLANDLKLSSSEFIKMLIGDYIYLKKNHKIDTDFRSWIEDLYEETMTKKTEVNEYKKRSRMSLIFGKR
jgi:metal-responsive CopG/Arc/MetJ family transcriptional regulator